MDEPVYLKSPAVTATAARDRSVSERVSEMLSTIEAGGIDAVRRLLTRAGRLGAR